MIRRLLASVLGDRRQPQKMKREQAVNDRSKVDTSRVCRSANRFTKRDDVLSWLSLAWFVPSAVRRSGCCFGLRTTFSVSRISISGCL